MLLYLLRHADADTVAESDDARALSEKGAAQAKKIARFCAERELRPEVLLASPLTRTRQTAAPIGERLGVEVLIAPWLASGMTPATATAELREYLRFESVMIVGHEPDFSLLIAHLLGLPDHARFVVRKGSLTLLEFNSPRAGAAIFHFSLPCRLI